MFVEKHYRNNLPMYFTTEVGAAKNTTRMRLESGRRIRKQKGTIGSVYSRLPPVTSCAFYCRLRAFAAGRTTTYATKAHLNLDIATKFGAGASSCMLVPLSPLRGFVIGSCCADFFTCVRLRRAWLCDSAGAPMVGRVYNGALRPTDSGPVSVHPESKGKLASSEAGEGESDASGATAQGGGGVFRSGSTSRASSPTSLGPSGDAAAGYADFLPS